MAPAATALSAGDARWLDARLPAARHPPSEYAFANLYLFRHRHRYRLVAGPVPHLSGVTYDGERHALPLAPLDRAGADALLAAHDCLYPFGAEGEAIARALGLACEAREADSDYVFAGDALARLAGAKARRAQARAFAGRHAPVLHPAAAAVVGELDGILSGWLADTGRTPAATDAEECREAIALMAPLELGGALVRTGAGEPVAFMLTTARRDGEHVVHFAKARRDRDGACPWMFARYAAASGAARLNFEQDLGNPGFAQAKRAYAPLERRRKYRLRRR